MGSGGMPTWVIGDVHGCWLTLRRLLEQIDWRRGGDTLCFVGDLVNRGPSSLEILRWAVRNRGEITAVLGNHDLHLLSRAAGVAPERKEDTLDEILGAPDRDELLDWLRGNPMLHLFGPNVMVHAGLMPEWDLAQASDLARAVGKRLAGRKHEAFLKALMDRRKRGWSGEADGAERAVSAAAVFSRLRMVDEDGDARLEFTGAGGKAPVKWKPWYDDSVLRREGYRLLFGHWAMLGFSRGPGFVCLDSGCVYGGWLSAMRLDDGSVARQELVDEVRKGG